MRFFVHDAEGNITEAGDCGPTELQLRGGPGLTVREGEASPIRQYYDIATGTVADYDEATVLRRFAVRQGFRWSRGQWIDERPLSLAKFHKWQEIKRARTAAEFGTFTAGGHELDADRDSQIRLMSAMQSAIDARSLGEPFQLDWTLTDGTEATLTRAQVIGAGRALQQHVNAQQTKAKALKAQIEAATTVAQVDAVVW
jgi:Domain of unknown function (DUF4376)